MLTPVATSAVQAYQQISGYAGVEPSGRQENSTESIPPVQPVADSVAVSDEGSGLMRRSGPNTSSEGASGDASADGQKGDGEVASTLEEKKLSELQARDRKVRAHEQAHLAAAGQYASSGATFSYERGSDGKLYATGGEVAIDIGRENTPEETILKMQTVRRAALAPANPSAADRQIAAQASVRLTEAQQQLQAERLESFEANTISTDNEDRAERSEDSQPPAVTGAIANRRAMMAKAYKAVNELL